MTSRTDRLPRLMDTDRSQWLCSTQMNTLAEAAAGQFARLGGRLSNLGALLERGSNRHPNTEPRASTPHQHSSLVCFSPAPNFISSFTAVRDSY